MVINIGAVRQSTCAEDGRPFWKLNFGIIIKTPHLNILFSIKKPYLYFNSLRELTARKRTNVDLNQGDGNVLIELKGETMILLAAASGGAPDSKIKIPLLIPECPGGQVQDVLALLGAALDHAEKWGWYIAE